MESKIVDINMTAQTIVFFATENNLSIETIPILLSQISASSKELQDISETLKEVTNGSKLNFISSIREDMDVVHGGINYASLSSFKEQFKGGNLDLQLPRNYP